MQLPPHSTVTSSCESQLPGPAVCSIRNSSDLSLTCCSSTAVSSAVNPLPAVRAVENIHPTACSSVVNPLPSASSVTFQSSACTNFVNPLASASSGNLQPTAWTCVVNPPSSVNLQPTPCSSVVNPHPSASSVNLQHTPCSSVVNHLQSASSVNLQPTACSSVVNPLQSASSEMVNSLSPSAIFRDTHPIHSTISYNGVNSPPSTCSSVVNSPSIFSSDNALPPASSFGVAAPLVPPSSANPDLVVCSFCNKTFKKKGLANHTRSCKVKNGSQNRLSISMPLNNPSSDNDFGAVRISTKVFFI